METELHFVVRTFLEAYLKLDDADKGSVDVLISLIRTDPDECKTDPSTFNGIVHTVWEVMDRTPPQPPIIICERDKESPDGN
jgi:hypothetical protein